MRRDSVISQCNTVGRHDMRPALSRTILADIRGVMARLQVTARPPGQSIDEWPVGRSVETNEAWAMTRRHVATQARAIRLITAVT